MDRLDLPHRSFRLGEFSNELANCLNVISHLLRHHLPIEPCQRGLRFDIGHDTGLPCRRGADCCKSLGEWYHRCGLSRMICPTCPASPFLTIPPLPTCPFGAGCRVDGLCLNYDYIASRNLGELVKRGYGNTPLLQLPLRCSACQSKNCRVIVGPETFRGYSLFRD
jgi:hypothetical protein